MASSVLCVHCGSTGGTVRPFPCGCSLPIHPACVMEWKKADGRCTQCNQVWRNHAMSTTTVCAYCFLIGLVVGFILMMGVWFLFHFMA